MNNDIVKATRSMSYRALVSYIRKIHEVRYFMPPFAGTELESRALAAYIAGGLHGKDVQEPQQAAGTAAKGQALFEENCSSCHAVEDLAAAFEGVEQNEIVEMLKTLNEISDEMEPFDGSEEEQQLLSGYLSSLNEVETQEEVIDGKEVFKIHCTMCHGVSDMKKRTVSLERQDIFTMLGKLDQLQKAMPPFKGTTPERKALADFLASNKQGGQ